MSASSDHVGTSAPPADAISFLGRCQKYATRTARAITNSVPYFTPELEQFITRTLLQLKQLVIPGLLHGSRSTRAFYRRVEIVVADCLVDGLITR